MNHDLSEYQDDEGFVLFGPVARSRLQEQCQYASRLITGRLDGYPALGADLRSEEHTSELPSLMRNSYAVFCLKNKKPLDFCQAIHSTSTHTYTPLHTTNKVTL